MAKAAKKVFEPTKIETEIGGYSYTIEPQPIGNIVEFDEVLSQIGGTFDQLVTGYTVITPDGEELETYDTREEAEDYVSTHPDGDLDIKVEGTGVRDFLEQIVGSPYYVLKPLIPDLEQGHVALMTFPELEFIIALLIEVNGIGWFGEMVGNLVEPLLPKLIEIALGAVQSGVTPNSTGDQTENSGAAH
jgi:hypothetical protein